MLQIDKKKISTKNKIFVRQKNESDNIATTIVNKYFSYYIMFKK